MQLYYRKVNRQGKSTADRTTERTEQIGVTGRQQKTRSNKQSGSRQAAEQSGNAVTIQDQTNQKSNTGK